MTLDLTPVCPLPRAYVRIRAGYRVILLWTLKLLAWFDILVFGVLLNLYLWIIIEFKFERGSKRVTLTIHNMIKHRNPKSCFISSWIIIVSDLKDWMHTIYQSQSWSCSWKLTWKQSVGSQRARGRGSRPLALSALASPDGEEGAGFPQ